MLADAWEGSFSERHYNMYDVHCVPDPEHPGFWRATCGQHVARARKPWRAVAFLLQHLAKVLLEENTETPMDEEETCAVRSSLRSV